MSLSAIIRVEGDGSVKYLDADGQPLNDYLTTLAKRQQGAKIKALLVETSERVNAEVEALGRLHHFTPAPDETPTRARREFEKKEPVPPVPRKVCLLSRILGRRSEIEAENADYERLFALELAKWQREKTSFDKSEDEESRKFDHRLRTDAEFMQQVLEDNLQDISWPREEFPSRSV